MNKHLIGAAVAAALAFPGVMEEASGTEAGGGASTTPKKEREVLKVKMNDGREVEFVGKRKLLKESIINGSTVSVRLDFRNGETRLFPVPDALLLKSAGHGMEQKLGDETAGEDDVDDMVEAVDDMIKRLSEKGLEGWTAKREGGGFSGASILVKALMEVTAKPKEEVQGFLKAKVDAGATYPKLAAAFEEDDTVGPVIKRLRKEKAAGTGVDTKALLGGLQSASPAPAAG
jgi:hypothetical protein